MQQHLDAFQVGLKDCRELVVSAHRRDAAGAYLWQANARTTIVEASFLRLFIFWESFLERTFIGYMLGEASSTGLVLARHVVPLDKPHANGILIGAGSKSFYDWSTPDVVRKSSKLFFDQGRPYDIALAEIHSDLLDLKTIRNAAAHISTSTSAPLDALATRKLGRSVTGYSAADLLLSIDPRANPPDTFFNCFSFILDIAARKIASAL